MHSCVFWCEWNSHNRAEESTKAMNPPQKQIKDKSLLFISIQKVKYNHIKRSLDYE